MKCECGRELVRAYNGEWVCAGTLETFKAKYGYVYGTKP